MTTALLLLATLAPTQAPTVRVLYYGQGSMASVIKCHESRHCGVGNWVPGMKVRHDITGFTAVNWASRWMLGKNVVVVAKLYDPVRKVWSVERLAAVDHQRKQDATRAQRLEVDYATARRLHFVGRNTMAYVIRYEVGK